MLKLMYLFPCFVLFGVKVHVGCDSCVPNPCQNGGTCTKSVNSFICTCAAGWTGSTCSRSSVVFLNGYGTFTVSLSMYNDRTYTTLHSSFPAAVHLDRRFYFAVQLHSNDANVVVLIEKCSTSPTTDKSHPSRYFIIENRCATDSTVQFHNEAPDRKVKFSFKTFKFYGHSQVYLYCQAFICLKDSSDSRCSSGCTGNNIKRVRRSATLETEEEIRPRSLEKRDAEEKEVNDYPPLKTYNLNIGPFVESKQGPEHSFNGNDGKSSFTHGMIIVTVVLAIAVGFFITKNIVKKFGERKWTGYEKRHGNAKQESQLAPVVQ